MCPIVFKLLFAGFFYSLRWSILNENGHPIIDTETLKVNHNMTYLITRLFPTFDTIARLTELQQT